MQDRISTDVLSNGATKYKAYNSASALIRSIYVLLADEPLVEDTPLTQTTLLTSATAAKVWRNTNVPTNPTVNEALAKLAEQTYSIGDILTTVRVLAAPWHLCDGSTFSQTTYPDLYAILGGTTLPNISYSDDTGTYIKMANA